MSKESEDLQLEKYEKETRPKTANDEYNWSHQIMAAVIIVVLMILLFS